MEYQLANWLKKGNWDDLPFNAGKRRHPENSLEEVPKKSLDDQDERIPSGGWLEVGGEKNLFSRWPYRWVTGVISPYKCSYGPLQVFITGRGAPCMEP